MRVTIVPIDGVVIIDGNGILGVDMSSIDPSIHAVQWYGANGSVEYKDVDVVDFIKITHNEEITDISQFQEVIDLATLELEQQALAQAKLAQASIVTDQMLEEQIRNKRNFQLIQSDWTQLPDVSLRELQQTQWKTYRQQLRDITLQHNFPTDIIWPEKPR